MAQLDPILLPAAPVLGIAEPHQSTVAAILRSAGHGLFTAAEAESMISRLRTLVPAPPLSIENAASQAVNKDL